MESALAELSTTYMKFTKHDYLFAAQSLSMIISVRMLATLKVMFSTPVSLVSMIYWNIKLMDDLCS